MVQNLIIVSYVFALIVSIIPVLWQKDSEVTSTTLLSAFTVMPLFRDVVRIFHMDDKQDRRPVITVAFWKDCFDWALELTTVQQTTNQMDSEWFNLLRRLDTH